MRRLLTKGWLLFMLVIVALSVVGIGYTLWNKQQIIQGVVNLDDIDVVKVKAFTNDNNTVDDASKDADDIGQCVHPDGTVEATSCDPKDVPAGDGTTPRYDKDIATCTAEVDVASTGQKVNFHVFDGYPSYHCTLWFDDFGKGSVPAALQRIKLDGEVICPGEWYDVDADQDGNADANVMVTAPELGTQLDQGDTVQGQVNVHVKEGAPQGKAIAFHVYLVWTSWNEYDPDATGCMP